MMRIYIYKNMINGTSTEISNHIKELSEVENFNPKNNTVNDTVRKHLRIHSDAKSSREKSTVVLHYDPETKIYSKFENGEVIKSTLYLKNDRAKSTISVEEKITIERSKDLGSEHKKMLDVIEKYAIKAVKGENIEAYSIEKTYDIDYLEQRKEGFDIYEVKSYESSIYTAIGQLLFYKGRLETRHTSDSVNMFIVGNFKLPEKYSKVLKDTKIKYKNINEFKK